MLHRFLLFCLVLCPLQMQGQLYINEIQASNINTILDHDGNYLQWVEIYNGGWQTVDLQGYYLSDSLEFPDKCKIGDHIIIPPGGHGLIWLDDPIWISCEFSLDMDGEELVLMSPSWEILDYMAFPRQFVDLSYGRQEDGDNQWVYFDRPSPKLDNPGDGIAEPIFADSIRVSLPGGIYQEDQMLELSVSAPGATIRYTLDGSWPDHSSMEYSEPIELSTTTVVRARAFAPDRLHGPVHTSSYIFNENTLLPVISISTDPYNYFDDRYGMYVEGTNGTYGVCWDGPANWNRDWERPANFEYFLPGGEQVVNQLVGTKISGACSRSITYKPFSLYARKVYGDNTLSHAFFKDKPIEEFTRLTLRNSGNDGYYSLFRDGFMQTLVKGKMDLDYQSYQPAVIYINGEFWGLLNLREKLNEHYVQANYDIDREDVDVLEKRLWFTNGEAVNGSGEDYEELINFVKANDLSVDENFQHVASKMDVEEFMNYYLVQIYVQNEDWPHNNIKYWRWQGGSKWRWLLFDTDTGWGRNPHTGNCLEWATRGSSADDLIRGLLENPWFESEFIQRLGAMANTVFHPDVVSPIYDSIKQMVDPEIIRHRARWNGRPLIDRYALHTEEIMPEFTLERPDIIRGQVRAKFGISGIFELSSTVSGQGKVKAAGMDLPHQFSGPFFNDTDLRLEAIPESGYVFSHWEGSSSSSSPSISFNTSNSLEVRAVFVESEPVDGVMLNEITASNLQGHTDEFAQADDWLEIVNNNDFAVDLAGWYLGDTLEPELMYRIPDGFPGQTTIDPGSFILFWCDGLDLQGPQHTNFKLNRGGEGIYLVQFAGDSLLVADSLCFGKQFQDISYGRIPGTASWDYMKPTPLALNVLDEPRELVINEFSSFNEGFIRDEYGEADDWIEIYNPTDEAIDLGGLFLTDSLGKPLKHQIPQGNPSTVVPPGEFIILWADKQSEQGPLHLDFRLDGKEEEIGLYQLGAGYIDRIEYSKANSGEVQGRLPDGSGSMQLLSPTPGSSNIVRLLKDLYINEFMAANGSAIADDRGEFDDWIEIYNAGDTAVDIGGLYLSDSLGHPAKYRIPAHLPDSTTIPSGGFLLLWADNEEEQGVLHMGFRLGADGEDILLSQADGKQILDSLSYTEAISDQSMGRLEDGSRNLQFLSATPGGPNRVIPVENLFINEYMASNRSTLMDEYGDYDDWIEIFNAGDTAVDIGGLYLSDSLFDPNPYRIPSHAPDSTTIPAGGYLLLWADGEKEEGALHMDFRLSAEGEEILLLQSDRESIIDSLSYINALKDQSVGRLEDGSDNIQWLSATPGSRNQIRRVEDLFINEFMASNRSTIQDEYGDYDDWIEIYNAGERSVDIGGLYLSDSLGDPVKYRIPSHAPDSTTIPSGGYLLLWADGETEEGILHMDFRLNSGREEILLVQEDGATLVDSLSYRDAETDQAFGRLEDGSQNIQRLSATPQRSNMVRRIESLRINEFMAINGSTARDEHGDYDDWIEIYNAGDTAVDIGGLYISDSLGNPALYRIPSYTPDSTTIPAGGYLLLWADGEPEQGVLHLDFRLSGDGEEICMAQADGMELIDSLIYGEVYPNMALGYLDEEELKILTASPGHKNYLNPLEKIFISEIMASGNSVMSDNYGEYDDWIELYNDNHYPVDIGGMYISDSIGDTMHYRIPAGLPDSTTIAPGDHLVLWADNQPEQGIRHLGFRLRGKGEEVILTGPNGLDIVDTVSYPDQYKNFSYSRLYGTGQWMFLPPTFESRNIIPEIQGIRINEFMASNNIYANEYGLYSDWIELHNASDEAFNVGGLYLTDSLGKPDKYRIPSHSPELTTIPGGGYLLVYADNKDVDGVLHTSFRLGKEGEQLGLVHYDGLTILDSLSYGKNFRNASSGRLEDKDSWFTLPPSPGEENCLPDFSGLMINEVMGFNRTIWGDEHNEYDDWIELYNASDAALNIGGLFLSDSLGDNQRYRISSTCPDSMIIQAGEHFLIWADGSPEQGVLHSDMRIAKTGEQILLYAYDGSLIDSVMYPFISPNHSWGRALDGDARWSIFKYPTPLKSNGTQTATEMTLTKGDFSFYPNPVREILYVTIRQMFSKKGLLQVCDLKGRVLISKALHPDQENYTIQTDMLESGLYIIRLMDGSTLLGTAKFTRIR